MVDLNYCGVFSLVSISCMVVWTHCSKKSPKIQVLKAIQFTDELCICHSENFRIRT